MRTLETARRPGARSIAALGLAVALAACGGQGGPTTGGTAAPTSTDGAPPTPASTDRATPAPTFAALDLLWEKGGPAGDRVSTWWPAIEPKTGNIWVAASYDSTYWIFSPDGKYLESWGSPGDGPGAFNFLDHSQNPVPLGAIAFAPDGSFYVGDAGNDRIQKFDKNRKYVKEWGSFGFGEGKFGQITGVVTDGKTVYVADGESADIQAFDPDGTFLRRLGAAEGVGPFMALDAEGILYTTNPEGSQPLGVFKFDAGGAKVGQLLTAFATGKPGGVAVGPSGHIFVTFVDPRPPYHQLSTYELDAAGQPLHAWSSTGESIVLAPDGSAIYFAREGNDRTGWGFIRKFAIPTS